MTQRGKGGARSKRKARPSRAAAPRPAVRAPRLQLEVVDRGSPRTERRFLREVVRAALAFVGRPTQRVSLLLTDDAEIARIHAEHLDDATPTDVISFDCDGDAELVISVETAKRTANSLGHTLRAEVALYVVHGLLHIAGYDDLRAAPRRRMRAAERAVLARLGLEVAAVDA